MAIYTPGHKNQPPSNPPRAKNLATNDTARLYTFLNGVISDKLGSREKIPSSTPIITNEDKERGYITRVVIKRKNKNVYYETTNQLLRDYSSKYDDSLYTFIYFKWSIIRNTQKLNKSTLEKLEKKHKGISVLFPKLDQFMEVKDPNVQKQKDNLLDINLTQVPAFTTKQWNLFSRAEKEQIIIKYQQVNIIDGENNNPPSITPSYEGGGSSGGGGGGY